MAQIDCFVALIEVIESLVYSHLILFALMHNHLHHVLAVIIQRKIISIVILSTLFQVHWRGLTGIYCQEPRQWQSDKVLGSAWFVFGLLWFVRVFLVNSVLVWFYLICLVYCLQTINAHLLSPLFSLLKIESYSLARYNKSTNYTMLTGQSVIKCSIACPVIAAIWHETIIDRALLASKWNVCLPAAVVTPVVHITVKLLQALGIGSLLWINNGTRARRVKALGMILICRVNIIARKILSCIRAFFASQQCKVIRTRW